MNIKKIIELVFKFLPFLWYLYLCISWGVESFYIAGVYLFLLFFIGYGVFSKNRMLNFIGIASYAILSVLFFMGSASDAIINLAPKFAIVLGIYYVFIYLIYNIVIVKKDKAIKK